MRTKHITQATKILARTDIPAQLRGISFLQLQCACHQHSGNAGEYEFCRMKRDGVLHRTAINSSSTHEAPLVIYDALNLRGQPLDPATRAFMEPRFGHDFSQVRVHTDAKAAESARAVNALAYTVGQDVVFGQGQYMPQTRRGKHLLAHELTHVVQQARGGTSSQPEQRADAASASVMWGEAVLPAILGGASRSVQMKPNDSASKPTEATPTADPSRWSKTLDKFNHNDAALTDGHRKSVDALAAEIAARVGLVVGARVTIMISGHTDTSGDEKYNESLGLKRANVAKAALEVALSRKKADADRIAGVIPESFGEKNLAIETADNVKEPLNRRVVITVKIEGPSPSTSTPASIPSSETKPEERKKPLDLELPPDYKLPEEDWWKRTEREQEKIREYDRTHPHRPKSLNDMLVEGVTKVLEPIINKLPKSLRDKAREGIRKGIEAGTEKACETAIDASGVTGKEAEAMKAACKAALKTIPSEKK